MLTSGCKIEYEKITQCARMKFDAKVVYSTIVASECAEMNKFLR